MFEKLKGLLTGQRKLTVGIFGIASVGLMYLLGDLTSADASKDIGMIVVAYMGGNGLEHIGDGMAKKG
jgi:hypothetical protein